METKQCPRCKETLPISSFQKNKVSKDGLQYHCKDCRKEIDSKPEKRKKDRERYHQNKDIYRNSRYKNAYGISLEEYNKRLKIQKGVCAVCNTVCSTGRALAVDHNHTTGEVRGLLCSTCNRGLGYFKDDINLLQNAIGYLEKKYATNTP